MIATYASYARKDTRAPLLSMLVQGAVCLSLAAVSLLVRGWAVLLVIGLALSAAVSAAALHLTARVWRSLRERGTERLGPSVIKVAGGAAAMAGPAWLAAFVVTHAIGRPIGPRLGIAAAAVVGLGVYLGVEALWRAPELGWLVAGLGHVRQKAARGIAGVTSHG
jgi:putative peptidoglycan lipid II flippase